MKRKAQATEFKPPQQRFTRLSRQNSAESSASGEITEPQLSDGNQIADTVKSGHQSALLIDNSEEHWPESPTEKSASANMHEIDGALVIIPTDVKQTNLTTTESAECGDIKCKLQSGSALEQEVEATGMEGRHNEDTASHKQHTSYIAESSPNNICHRYSLDETGEDLLCGNAQENMPDPKAKGTHLEWASDAVGKNICFDSETKLKATEETESLKPPAKKRLRRRMGMCGLGDRKRRFLLEAQQCKQVLNGEERLEAAETAGEKYKGILTNSTGVENGSTAMMDGEETTKQVLFEQVIPAGASLTGQDVNKVQDGPSVVAKTNECDVERKTSAEPNLPGTGTYSDQDIETKNPKGLPEEEWFLSYNENITEGTHEVGKETTSPDAEEGSYGSIDVASGDSEGPNESPEYPVTEGVSLQDVCEDPKQTSEWSFEVAEKESYGTISLTSEVSEVSKKTSECLVPEQVSSDFTEEVFEEPKEKAVCPVAKQVSFGFTVEVFEESLEKNLEKSPVADKVTYGVTDEVIEGSKEKAECPVAKQVSYGVTDDVIRGSNETAKCPIAKQVSYGVTDDVIRGSNETAKCPIAKQVSYGVTDDVIRGSNETAKCPIAKQVSYGVADEVFEGLKENAECPVAEQVSYVVTDEGCEGSNETKMIYGSIAIADDLSEDFDGSKEVAQVTIAVNGALSCGSTAVTDEGCKDSKEATECPVSGEVVYSPIDVTDEINEGFKEATEGPVNRADGISLSSVGITDEVCEGQKNTTDLHVKVGEEVSYSSTSVTSDACESSKTPNVNQVEISGEVSHGSISVTGNVCEGATGCPVKCSEKVSCASVGDNEVDQGAKTVSKEVQESITALEESEMKTEEQCPADSVKNLESPSFDLDATNVQEQDGPQLSALTADDEIFMEHAVTAAAASTELAFSEICHLEDECNDVEFSPTLTNTVARMLPDGVEGGSSKEEPSVPEAPPTGQETHIHFLLSQDVSDPLVAPAIAEEPVSNTSLTPATEFRQDSDIVPLSLYSVTDSQLNNLALSMEVDDQPMPEGIHHQEDATELVCGLIKELSSLNRTVMAAHREMELLRRGNRPPKAPIRRSYGPRNSEV